MVFSVRYADVKLKISLDAKWQARSLQQAVVVPFVKAFNKKHPSSSVSENGLLGILADGAAWLDSTQTAAAVPASTTVVELFFGSKDELQIRQCRVRYGDVALKIEMDEKWLRQPFAQAVLVPFTIAYNKKPVPSALRVEDFSGADVDGDQLSAAEAAKPTVMVVPAGTKSIDLAFGAGGAGTMGGDADSSMLSERERLRAFWRKVRNVCGSALPLHLAPS